MSIPCWPLCGGRQGGQAAKMADYVVRASRYLKTHTGAKQAEPLLGSLRRQMLQGERAQGISGTMCHAADHPRRH
ncbi:hypothetical protein GA0115246_105053 [Streptomyces sp. SolWspMP-sol7th]|nr:hypothetical protein GA0115246_105053 [Streptomyces sp. SolWspMP-sol7th]